MLYIYFDSSKVTFYLVNSATIATLIIDFYKNNYNLPH
ncbi:hypothetical protein PMAN_a1499 [Pseudoalteromonas marina]|nr:hypothetical protein PMAN_a1499 [Pseudoalteromonas marina]